MKNFTEDGELKSTKVYTVEERNEFMENEK